MVARSGAAQTSSGRCWPSCHTAEEDALLKGCTADVVAHQSSQLWRLHQQAASCTAGAQGATLELTHMGKRVQERIRHEGNKTREAIGGGENS
jgi:hypothetical protein